MATAVTEPRSAERTEAFLAALARMGSDGRLAIYRSGGFSRRECALWAANYPEEAPIVNGEYEWIALRLADLDVGSDRAWPKSTLCGHRVANGRGSWPIRNCRRSTQFPM